MQRDTSLFSNLRRYREIPIAVALTNDGLFTPMIGYSDDSGFRVEVYSLSGEPSESYSSFDLAWKAAELVIDEIHQLLEIEKHTQEDQSYSAVKLLPEAIVRLELKLK